MVSSLYEHKSLGYYCAGSDRYQYGYAYTEGELVTVLQPTGRVWGSSFFGHGENTVVPIIALCILLDPKSPRQHLASTMLGSTDELKKPLRAFISFPSPYTQTLLLQALVSSLPSLAISLIPPEDDDPPQLQW
jgi:hypothetical protein